MLHVQKFLLNGGTLDQLARRFGVKSRRHTNYPNLVLLKYDMVESPFHEPLVRECRGIILDETNGWRIVSRSFDKFFNYGEGHAAEVDWKTATIQEKLDGSLMVLHYYNDKWHVATSGSPDASGNVHNTSGYATFADYFWDTFKKHNGKLPTSDHKDYSFAFELMGPDNRIVVVHTEPKLRLIGVRNHQTGQEFKPAEYSELLNIQPVGAFQFANIYAVIASLKDMPPLLQEGYIIVDDKFNRIKVKSPAYLHLHHAKDGMGPRAFYEIARAGEISEVANAFPDFKPLIEAAKTKFEALVSEVENDYKSIECGQSQKEFALKAIKTRCSAALFQQRKGVAIRDFLREVQIDKVLGWLSVQVDDDTNNTKDEV